MKTILTIFLKNVPSADYIEFKDEPSLEWFTKDNCLVVRATGITLEIIPLEHITRIKARQKV